MAQGRRKTHGTPSFDTGFLGYGGTDGWDSDETLQHDDQADLVVAARHMPASPTTVDVVGHSYGGAGAVRIVLRELANVRSSLILHEPMLAPLLAEAGENKLFGEYEFLAHVFLDRTETERDAWAVFDTLCRGLRGRATHRHTGRRQLCPLRRQHVAGRLQIIVTSLAVVRLSLSPRLVSPGSYEAAGQIGPLPRPQDALYEPEQRWARYADHRILHLIVAERIF